MLESLKKKYASGRNTFQKYLPEEAVEYCFELWLTYSFRFKITKDRQSKLGDYRYDPTTKIHSVTVNHNLNKYQFLITYIHEVAHLAVHKKYGNRVSPHGNTWKNQFKELFLPVLNDKVFPDDILRVLARHMKNPKASTHADPNLSIALAAYDDNHSEITFLDAVPEGELFNFRNKKYKKLETRRTRVICLEVSSGKKYLINKVARVTTEQD
ncbi:SprT-like domain-containing protein [Marinigracilibium pacificum]|uniref:Transcription elongation protein SprT n=1 Tax=Marinigracilibium pacificum TaxID=2729599 RepID=A0A848J9J0_9BACT|nr:SprT-like domain-containing protein [Marinigracilibium pacificum]NMM49712.1 transcription elongation protein SprT [Marinigracilibium pacificum]